MNAAGRVVRVDAPDGLRDATARVECVEPASAPVAIDASREAALPDGCAKARCTSERWLGAEADKDTCRLGRAVALSVELPEDARGRFVVRLEPRGGGTAVERAVLRGEGDGRSGLPLPPVPPGSYVLRVGRQGDPWSCSSSPPMRQPERLRLRAPWREAAIQRGRVTSVDGKPVSGIPLRTDAAGLTGRPTGVEGTWTCSLAGSEPMVSAADGSFQLKVDPGVETLVVAGSWDDARGIAFRARQGTSVEAMQLVARTPHRIVARVLDDRDAAVPCKAFLGLEDRLESWTARAVTGSVREASCAADGALRLGPVLSRPYELEVHSEAALPARRRGESGPGSVTDLGVIRVDRGLSMSVDVRDLAKSPISGAHVSARNRDGLVVTRKARTDAAGLAVLAGLPREASFDLRVEARDFAAAEKTRVEAGGTTPIKIVLSRGCTLRGRVTTPDGQPADGATVARSAGADFSQTESGPDGTFELDVAPGAAEVLARLAGFADSEPVRVEVDPERPPNDLELKLRERTLVQGTVVDPDGRPVSGANVLLLSWKTITDPLEAGAVAATTSDYEGGFTIPEPRPGQNVVALFHGFAPGVAEYAQASESRALELRLGPAAAVRVKLPDSFADDGMLDVRDGSSVQRRVSARSRTDLTIEDLTPPVAHVALSNGPTKVAQLVPGETTLIDFRSGGAVRGRVTRAGRGVPRAVVACVERASTGSPSSGTALTDDDGRFALEVVSAGPRRIVAQASEGRGEASVNVPEGGEAQVEVELVDARLELLVTDAGDGHALRDAQIYATHRDARCQSFSEMGSNSDEGGWHLSLADTGCAFGASAADGRASFAMSTLGPYTLSVRAQDYEPWLGKVDVADGSVEVHATLTPGGGAPRVRVFLQSEPPGASGSLYCVQPQRNSSRSPVAAEGVCENLLPGPIDIAFRVPGLGIGRTSLVVPEHGETQATVQVVRGGDLALPLPEGARVPAIRVVDDAGTLWNQPSGLGWPECSSSTNADGTATYVCRGLPPGPYTVEIDGQRRATVVVRPGETTTIY